jgi:hypothetical protein
LLLIKLLLNRKLLPRTEREEILQIYLEFWPDLVMLLLVFCALRMMLVGRHDRIRTPGTQFLFSIVIAAGVLGAGLYVVIDRLLVTNLVHIAIDNVEKGHPIMLQRSDAFPSQRAEGFQTFWRATQMLGVVLGALGIVLLSTVLKSRGVLIGAATSFAACLLGGANYNWWFFTHEYPRLNPDMAGQGLALIRGDIVAGALLILGTSAVCGKQLACTRSSAGSMFIETPRSSGMLAIAAGSIGVSIGYEWLAALNATLTSPWWGGWTNRYWRGFFQNFCQNLLYPELMIPLAVCLSAWVVLWNYFKQPSPSEPHPSIELPLFDGWHFAAYSLATIAWLLVAVPTLAIFGFCYWLGPWVL